MYPTKRNPDQEGSNPEWPLDTHDEDENGHHNDTRVMMHTNDNHHVHSKYGIKREIEKKSSFVINDNDDDDDNDDNRDHQQDPPHQVVVVVNGSVRGGGDGIKSPDQMSSETLNFASSQSITNKKSPALSSSFEKFKICGLEITKFPIFLQVAICCGGLMLFYTLSGIAQESLFVSYKEFEYGFFLTLFQFVFNSIASCVQHMFHNFDKLPPMLLSTPDQADSNLLNNRDTSEIWERNKASFGIFDDQDGVKVSQMERELLPTVVSSYDGLYAHNDSTNKSWNKPILQNRGFDATNNQKKAFSIWSSLFKANAPISHYLALSLLSVLGIGLGNEGLNYVNYPTKMLLKSSKLLLVMVVGVVLKCNFNRYKLTDYIASFFIFIGLVSLYNANLSSVNTSQTTGLTLLAFSLIADSIAGNLQEHILKECKKVSPHELIFFTYLIGTVLILIVCIATDQLIPGIMFCVRNPSAILVMLLFCLLSYMGVQFVHSLTKLFGILVTLSVTSCRKVSSIILSYIIFPKPFAMNHAIAIICVFIGIFLRIYTKQKK